MATALATSERFFAPEITKIYWLPTIAATNLVPTRAELDAGTDLSAEIADISGWQVQGSAIETPDLGSRFTSNIPGRTSAPDSSITFYGDLAGVDIRGELSQDDNGYVWIADGGDVEAQLADVFPVRVNSIGKMRSVGDAAFQIVVSFTITAEPAVDTAIPADS